MTLWLGKLPHLGHSTKFRNSYFDTLSVFLPIQYSKHVNQIDRFFIFEMQTVYCEATKPVFSFILRLFRKFVVTRRSVVKHWILVSSSPVYWNAHCNIDLSLLGSSILSLMLSYNNWYVVMFLCTFLHMYSEYSWTAEIYHCSCPNGHQLPLFQWYTRNYLQPQKTRNHCNSYDAK